MFHFVCLLASYQFQTQQEKRPTAYMIATSYQALLSCQQESPLAVLLFKMVCYNHNLLIKPAEHIHMYLFYSHYSRRAQKDIFSQDLAVGRIKQKRLPDFKLMSVETYAWPGPAENN